MAVIDAVHVFHPEHKTIGEMLALLGSCESGLRVAFDFCGRAPNGLHPTPSPIGDISLGHDDLHDAQWPTAERLRDVLRGAVNQTFKTAIGFEFVATAETRLWVGEMREGCSRTVITGLDVRTSRAFITTALFTWDA